MQVGDDLTAKTPVLKKRTQTRGHDLGALRMLQAGRFGRHKANHISRSKLIEPNRWIGKNAVKKASDRVAIQANRRRRKSSVVQQIVFEFLSDSTSRRNCNLLQGACLVLIGSNKSAERMEREEVTTSTSSVQPTFLEVVGCIRFGKAVAFGPSLIKPGSVIIDQPARQIYRVRCVSLSLLLLDKHVDERQIRPMLRLAARVTECMSHENPQSHHKAWLVMKLCRANCVNRPLASSCDFN